MKDKGSDEGIPSHIIDALEDLACENLVLAEAMATISACADAFLADANSTDRNETVH